MNAAERRSQIKEILQNERTISVSALAGRFEVSESTVRRDLALISDSGAIRRTYGGAVMLDNLANELPLTLRERENIEAKNSIATIAASMISDGSTLILDTSSTVIAMVPMLRDFDGLTVITNGIKTSYLLNSYSRITTFCTGGRLREHNMSLVGSAACRRFEEINADLAFISCRGFSIEKGITEASDEEAEVKRAMINAAARVVLLCDASKFGMVLMNRVCPAARISAVVTDIRPEKKYTDYFGQKGIKLYYTKSSV
ncbi:MAG: DeoR/GlpR family DNA-binding transcription regulator [Eubacteriales bacterium]